ncbi:type I-C CRISPR-associated protein Cas8c/Csd1 [Streptomyces noursei]|uniref:type I-C CRISPR-associated protein Cas8c/Csd1 n=1 Tax=Streptomyces noursei TaxID=1971 RepID=UPI00045F05F9|nr:type I-C CRISPR-associated protein Cas8c/Csd1 [Streptomyces noursei]AIA06578.1 CRISPR-associated Csd1 family protein [Streptomyces noursei]
MLLRCLAEYADRAEGLPPAYYRTKTIQWVLQVEADGTTARLHAQRRAKGSKEKPLQTLAPDMYRSGKTPPPYLLVDTAQFVLGVPKTAADGTVSDTAIQEAERRRDEYAALLLSWAAEVPEDPGVQAVATFVSCGGLGRMKPPEGMAHSDNIAVMSPDSRWLHSLASAQKAWASWVRNRKADGGARDVCLVCEQEGELLATIPESVNAGAIPTSGQSRKAQLVSINAAAHGRGGVVQLVNTPICELCGSRSMAALNLLLADDRHRRRTAESVTVWWTREPADPLFDALDHPTEETVARLVDSLHTCPDPITAERLDPNGYYALTLALNNARVAVLDWLNTTVGRLRNHLGAWFEDHKVFDGWSGSYRYLPLWHLVLASGRWDDKAGKYAPRSAPRGLEDELLHAALTRGPMPARLLPHLLQRIRADRRIDAPRTALLRLALHPNRTDKEQTGPMPCLDDANQEPGYLCGRAFAVLEAIQRSALPEINATIGDKFFGTAMTAPAAVLTNLRNGANGHLKRLRRDKKGTYYALDARLADSFAALARIEGGIPVLLNTRQQAWFVLGYEQQRAADNAARAAHKAAQERKLAEADRSEAPTTPA